MKIGILGGSFDPITNGHIQLINKVSKYFNEIWLMPCNYHRLKDNLIDYKYRIDMVKLAMKDMPYNVKLSTFDIDNNFNGKTFDMLNAIKKENKKYTFYYIIGSDIVNSIKSYYNYDQLIADNNFCIIKRKGISINDKHLSQFFNEGRDNLILSNNDIPNISSTDIRNLIKEDINNNNLNEYLPNNILEYIKNNNLYNG